MMMNFLFMVGTGISFRERLFRQTQNFTTETLFSWNVWCENKKIIGYDKVFSRSFRFGLFFYNSKKIFEKIKVITKFL